MRARVDVRARVVLGAAALGLFACGGPPPQAELPVVIATTSILGDVVGRVGGREIEVRVLIPPGVDPHEFAPSAQQVATISAAGLVVANGLGLEEGMRDVLDQARSEGITVLELAPELEPLPLDGGFDPHFWQDPRRMETAVALIASALINDVALDPERTSERAASYALEIEQAFIDAEELLDAVPPGRRSLVTNHAAFAYFADRYGFEVLGTIVPGGSSLAMPSSVHLAELVALMIEHQVPAIFVEAEAGAGLATELAAEVGPGVQVVTLASDTLGAPGTDTDTYVGLVLHNARAVAAALG